MTRTPVALDAVDVRRRILTILVWASIALGLLVALLAVVSHEAKSEIQFFQGIAATLGLILSTFFSRRLAAIPKRLELGTDGITLRQLCGSTHAGLDELDRYRYLGSEGEGLVVKLSDGRDIPIPYAAFGKAAEVERAVRPWLPAPNNLRTDIVLRVGNEVGLLSNTLPLAALIIVHPLITRFNFDAAKMNMPLPTSAYFASGAVFALAVHWAAVAVARSPAASDTYSYDGRGLVLRRGFGKPKRVDVLESSTEIEFVELGTPSADERISISNEGKQKVCFSSDMDFYPELRAALSKRLADMETET